MSTQSFTAFQASLEKSLKWPCNYTFKFIVPKDELPSAINLFPGQKVETRESRNGRYVSVTAEMPMETSDQIISVYRDALTIKGIISL